MLGSDSDTRRFGTGRCDDEGQIHAIKRRYDVMWDHTYPNDPASLRDKCTLVRSLSPQAKLPTPLLQVMARRGD